MQLKKLDSVGLIAILFCARCFSALTYFPFTFSNSAAYMLGALLSAAIQLIILLPAAALGKKYAGCDPCTLAAGRSRTLGVAVALAYLAYFSFESFIDVGNFSFFMTNFFAGSVMRETAVVCFVLAAVYLAAMPGSTVGKTAQYAFICILLLIGVTFIGAGSHADFANFNIAQRDMTRTVLRAAKSETARCECLVLFVILMGSLDKDRSGSPPTHKTALIYLLLKTAAIEVTLTAVTLILGDYAFVTRLPFFSIASYSGSGISERGDAVFLFVWIFTGVVKLGVLLHCCAKCIKVIAPRVSFFRAAAGSAALPSAAAAAVTAAGSWEMFAYGEHGLWAIILLSAILPAFMLLMGRKEGYYGRAAAKAQ